jgi:hypothetical protein
MKFTKSVLKRLIAQTKPKKLPVRNLDDNNEKHNKLVNELATELFVMICDKQEKAKWSDR